MSAPKSGPGIWSCWSKQDLETKMFIAHCLDLNVKVSAENPDKAWQRLKDCLKAFYEYCYSCDPEALNLTAPASDWEEYKEALKIALRNGSVTVETIQLVLRPPRLPEQILPLSWQRVDFETQAAVVH